MKPEKNVKTSDYDGFLAEGVNATHELLESPDSNTQTKKFLKTTIEGVSEFYDKGDSSINIFGYGSDVKDKGIFAGQNMLVTDFQFNTTNLFELHFRNKEQISPTVIELYFKSSPAELNEFNFGFGDPMLGLKELTTKFNGLLELTKILNLKKFLPYRGHVATRHRLDIAKEDLQVKVLEQVSSEVKKVKKEKRMKRMKELELAKKELDEQELVKIDKERPPFFKQLIGTLENLFVNIF